MKLITCGVYFLFDGDELVYIGQSDNVFRRIGQHIAEKAKVFDSWEVYETDDYIRLEGLLINLLKPKYNRTNGTQILGISKDYHSQLVPSDRLLNLIEACEKKVISAYGIPLDKVGTEIAGGLDLGHTKRMMIRHYSEIPISRIDGKWYMDAVWYSENKERLKVMVNQWDNDMYQQAENCFSELQDIVMRMNT